jgi:hypothetical protein
VLAKLPESLRENFLLHRGPVGRPTRDRVFSLSGWQIRGDKALLHADLAGAGGGGAGSECWRRSGSCRWSARCGGRSCWPRALRGRGWGLGVAAALALGTAWPAFFLRGFYAEGVGTMLIGGAVGGGRRAPLRGGMAALAGFALGLSVSYHPTMVVLAVPGAWR